MNTQAGFEYTWRWFGPNDRITLSEIKQTGATGIVTALHQIPVGHLWPIDKIKERKNLIEQHGMTWSVVESVPVSEEIKKQNGDYLLHIENYKTTLINLANQGIKVVCYNFMPVLDWSRTDLKYVYDNGTESITYEYHKFAAFDLFILARDDAGKDYPKEIRDRAKTYFDNLTDIQKTELKDTILLGLPGSLESYSLDDFRLAIQSYQHINKQSLRDHLIFFLEQIVPVAEQFGIKLAIHPDDPPWPLLGLPRIVTGYDDLSYILNAVKSPANGITLCTGSLGAGYSNDLVQLSVEYAANIHFAHLRNVTRDVDRNFMENNLFDGDVDMVKVATNLLKESLRRKQNNHSKFKIPIRPDHGFQMLGDIGQNNYPGYGLYGRMKSLAEIRGLEMGIMAGLI